MALLLAWIEVLDICFFLNYYYLLHIQKENKFFKIIVWYASHI